MNTIAEAMMKLYTENRILCPICMKNNNFMYVVKHEGSQYYLGEKCPKCDHYEDFKAVPYRVASEYLPDKK